MIQLHNSDRRGNLLVAAAVAMLTSGVAAIGVGLGSNTAPPAPPPVVAAPPERGEGMPLAPSEIPSRTTGPIMEESTPTLIDIPAIGVSSALMNLGLNSDGTVEVPPVEPEAPAGWYDGSPEPGTLGPAVILGHVDTRAGPAVFYRLGELREGDEISVTREDGTIAIFVIDRVESYPKSEFPTEQVYGNTDHAALRLVTCGGPFDSAAGSYLENVVVYASLVEAR